MTVFLFHAILWLLTINGLVYDVAGCLNVARFLIIIASICGMLTPVVLDAIVKSYKDGTMKTRPYVSHLARWSMIGLAIMYVWFGHWVVATFQIVAVLVVNYTRTKALAAYKESEDSDGNASA